MNNTEMLDQEALTAELLENISTATGLSTIEAAASLCTYTNC